MRFEILTGVVFDLLLGDPRWLPHPIRGLGALIAWLETPLRRWLPPRLAGVLLWAIVVGVAAAVVEGTLRLIPYAAIYWIFALVAIRELDRQSAAVIAALNAGDLPLARTRLAMIVGRDTANLDEPEIVRACVETVAENLGDAVVAPLFYLTLGGPVAMAAYKAVNTLDSMVGYKDERYREFGWFSARADDWANYIPARLTAALIWIAALLPGFAFVRGVRVTLRDGASQPSPNAGYPEAAAAGALGVRLGGVNYYRGVASRKAYLGDGIVALSPAMFWRVRVLLYAVAALAVLGSCWTATS